MKHRWLWILIVQTLACRQAPDPQLRALAPSGEAAGLRAVVASLAAIEPPRSADFPASLDRAADLIADALSRAGLTPRFDAFSIDADRYRNVSALLGTGHRKRIVLGAHYDVWGNQPGADDNASGVAALLYVASHLAGRALPVDVELVAFTLEEPPFFRSADMGSARHARALAAADVEVLAMLSLEMLGYYSDTRGSQSFPDPALAKQFPNTGNFLAVIGRAQEASLLEILGAAMTEAGPLPVHVLAAPAELPGLDFSDHLSFWKEGYPALMVTDTAFLRNPHYHRASDGPETLDYVRLEQAARAVLAGVVALGEHTGAQRLP